MDQIIHLDSVDSTNTYIKHHPELWGRQLCAVMAREQTGGRGRYTRSWYSSPGRDLAISTIFNPPADTPDLSCFTLLSGLAVHRALRTYLDEDLNLKWPNDIRYGKKKLGGILCEAVFRDARPVIIIGIGVNVNTTDFPPDIQDRAISMKAVTGLEYSVDSIAREILDRMEELFLNPHGRKEDIIREWTGASLSIGRIVRFLHEGQELEGTIEGINADGSLRLRIKGGGRIESYRGEVLFSDED